MTDHASWRLAIDTGGTFTDLVIDAGRQTYLFKSPTTPRDPADGILNVLKLAADNLRLDLADFLGRVQHIAHGTTHGINAIVSGTTAPTALLVTQGHPDILLFREGGRSEPFNHTVEYPAAYVPRRLTFEVPERMAADGLVVRPLDCEALDIILQEIGKLDVQAIAVSLLWSIANPAHELAIAERITARLPGVPYTLGHRLNPSLREYRRTISTAIDASLKPIMGRYLASLEERLRTAGFAGRLMIITSQGGVMDAKDAAEAPIHMVNSGPSMAPVAGLNLTRTLAPNADIVVADTGGTTYDVSLIRAGSIPRTRETWLGQPFRSDMTGFPSIDVRSIGAGGGSIASVDSGGLLHVGPASAGADPGPACYGRGGKSATVTDAALVLGYLDPGNFADGRQRLDATLAAKAIAGNVGGPLGRSVIGSALAIMELATEKMVAAIEQITLKRGVDPQRALLVAGGGAAGFNSVAIARRLGCRAVLFPRTGAALSAAGGLMSELTTEFATVAVTSSTGFDVRAIEQVLAELRKQATSFALGVGATSESAELSWSVEARYAHQVWEIEIPLPHTNVGASNFAVELRHAFDRAHEAHFGIADPASPVEFIAWRVRSGCRLRNENLPPLGAAGKAPDKATRLLYLPDGQSVEAPLYGDAQLADENKPVVGPAIIEQPYTTIVIDSNATATLQNDGSILVAA